MSEKATRDQIVEAANADPFVAEGVVKAESSNSIPAKPMNGCRFS